MALKYCTFTGIDSDTDIEKITELSEKYPFIEWGVLSSLIASNRPRYPTLKWINNFIDNHPNVNTSIHLCHNATIESFFQRKIIDLCSKFKRIQINAQFEDYPGPPELIRRCFLLVKPTEVIIQYNNNSKEILEVLGGIGNSSILFDKSRGAGVLPDEWPTAIPFTFCGYAGGLGPENIEEQLPLIDAAAGGSTYWIDMETKVRSENEHGISCFDFEKVEQVAKIVEKFIQKREGLLSQPFPEGDMSLLFNY